MLYQVTTRASIIETWQKQRYQIVMVDGTVPEWQPQTNDLHFDHHRVGGAAIQIEEISKPILLTPDCVFVTTQVDADACVAAAYCQLDRLDTDRERKLKAIAWECDHLYVPDDLSDLAEFAACAVAAMKVHSATLPEKLGLPTNRPSWSIEQKELYSSAAFSEGTQWLIDAVQGERKFPGELGEAKQYWEKLKRDTQMLKDENRIRFYRGTSIIDLRGLAGKYIDPRCPISVIDELGYPETPITLTQREVFIDNELKGYAYTIGVYPKHRHVNNIDYTRGVYQALTEKERQLDPDRDSWGGRSTVGGSGWNTVSNLEPEQVIDLVLSCCQLQ
jgi:hypothetical protein